MDFRQLICKKHDYGKCPECDTDLIDMQDQCKCGLRLLWFSGDPYSCRRCNRKMQETEFEYGISVIGNNQHKKLP